ncbi:hypothetical protein PMIN04_001864 [Paraphaeosphaeria minitans]
MNPINHDLQALPTDEDPRTDPQTDSGIIHRAPAPVAPRLQFSQYGHPYTARTYPTLAYHTVILLIIAIIVMYIFHQLVELLSYNDEEGNLKYGMKDFALVLAILFLIYGR